MPGLLVGKKTGEPKGERVGTGDGLGEGDGGGGVGRVLLALREMLSNQTRPPSWSLLYFI